VDSEERSPEERRFHRASTLDDFIAVRKAIDVGHDDRRAHRPTDDDDRGQRLVVVVVVSAALLLLAAAAVLSFPTNMTFF
jgi:hypothetical protein